MTAVCQISHRYHKCGYREKQTNKKTVKASDLVLKKSKCCYGLFGRVVHVMITMCLCTVRCSDVFACKVLSAKDVVKNTIK